MLTPLLNALVWVVGFMYTFGHQAQSLQHGPPFRRSSVWVLDNGVHIFHRYQEVGRGSLRLVLRTTGVALLATSLTTMVGFSGLVSAIHPALTSIGVLSLVGLGSLFHHVRHPAAGPAANPRALRGLRSWLGALVVSIWGFSLSAVAAATALNSAAHWTRFIADPLEDRKNPLGDLFVLAGALPARRVGYLISLWKLSVDSL